MEQLIPVAAKLQDVLAAVSENTRNQVAAVDRSDGGGGSGALLDLPQIVVIGGQSSGKSSVLESLVGRSFLPRGTGIVTRRPLILQLFNTAGGNNSTVSDTSSSQSSATKTSSRGHASAAESESTAVPRGAGTDAETTTFEEWGEFLHKPGEKFYDFAAIRSEIVAETERVAVGQNISPQPIRLLIYSPHVLSLTLVDLPGMTKNPVGDQPADIGQQIDHLCFQYAKNPQAIILAVTTAVQDLANSDAIQLARKVDPEGKRTVGVLTKVDLMDSGTDCGDVLRNQVIPLQMGYIAVVNRGQREVVSDVSIRKGLKKESDYFKNHSVYGKDQLLYSRCGTTRLSQTLNHLLLKYIRLGLPTLETRIAALLRDVQEDLEALGVSPSPNSRSARGASLLRLLSQFATNFGALLEGRQTPTRTLHGAESGAMNRVFPGNGSNIIDEPDVASELIGGARISYIFTGIFGDSLDRVGSFDGLHDDEIRTVIANAHGTRPALFVPEVSFDILVRRQINRLEQPAKQCVDLVFGELQRIGKLAEPVELTRYPQLRDRLIAVTRRLLERSVQPTQMMVSHLVKIELAYINTSHPEFIGGSRAVARLMRQTAEQQRNSRRSARHQYHDDDDDDDQYYDEDAQKSPNHKSDATEVGSPSVLFDKENGKKHRGKKQSAKDAIPLTSTSAPNKPIHTSASEPPIEKPSGIMGLIFGGANENPTPSSGKFVGAMNSTGVNNIADYSSSSIASAGGPPSIVHLPQIPDYVKQPAMAPLTERERVEMEIIKSLVDSYFGIVRRNMIDMVPKTIMYFLVNHVRDSLQNELVSELYRDADVGTLMQEAEDIASRRQSCQEMKDLLGKAMDIVNEVKVFHPPATK